MEKRYKVSLEEIEHPYDGKYFQGMLICSTIIWSAAVLTEILLIGNMAAVGLILLAMIGIIDLF